jgi:hypothetical protein
MRGSRNKSSYTPVRSFMGAVIPGRATTPTARQEATAAQLAAASRAYRHLGWDTPGAIPEALAAVGSVGMSAAPALYRRLAVAITNDAVKQLRAEPSIHAQTSAVRALERLLEESRDRTPRIGTDELLDEALLVLSRPWRPAQLKH